MDYNTFILLWGGYAISLILAFSVGYFSCSLKVLPYLPKSELKKEPSTHKEVEEVRKV